MVTVPFGTKIGIGAIYPQIVIPMVREAKKRGFVWPVVKSTGNGGVGIDVKTIEPRTKVIYRYVNTLTDAVDTFPFYDGGSLRWQARSLAAWTPNQMRLHAVIVLDTAWNRLNPQERAAIDWLEPINEAQPNDPDQSGTVPNQRKAYPAGWAAYGEYLKIMIEEANQRGIKLAIPALNSGGYEWTEIVAMVGTSVFGQLKLAGGIFTGHDGPVDNGKVDEGFGETIPGSPVVPGAGRLFFRYRYWYYCLKQRNEVVPYVSTEAYYGGSYTLPVSEQVARMAWVDREMRKDEYVLGHLPFTADPDGGWQNQNYNYVYTDPGGLLDYAEAEKDKANIDSSATPPPPPDPIKPHQPPFPDPIPTSSSTVRALVGLHGRADGRMQPADFAVVKLARIEAVKLTSDAAPEDVDALKRDTPGLFIVVRLIASFKNGRHVLPGDFTEWILPNLEAFYAKGVRYFEVHNEPNLVDEGWGACWADGSGFAAWFEAVVTRLRLLHPDLQLGWPGLSPGPDQLHIRTEPLKFLSEVSRSSADWIGVHIYWQTHAEMLTAAQQIGEYRKHFPNKPLMVTEFADLGLDMSVKGAAYNEFYELLAGIPDVMAGFAFAVSSSSGYESQVWRDESGQMSAIPAIVGSRGQAAPPVPVPTITPDQNANYRVAALVLNVRAFPWAGNTEPAVMGQLKQADKVTVYGTYKSEAMAGGWGCISPDGNRWVSMKYLQAIS